jgi:hypothetical protein
VNPPHNATIRQPSRLAADPVGATAEYWAVLAGVAVACGFGVVSRVAPAVDEFVVLAAVAVGLVWLAVATLRRELRIRRRLAAIQPIAAALTGDHPARSLAHPTTTDPGATR